VKIITQAQKELNSYWGRSAADFYGASKSHFSSKIRPITLDQPPAGRALEQQEHLLSQPPL
jgi:hypothetical protein